MNPFRPKKKYITVENCKCGEPHTFEIYVPKGITKFNGDTIVENRYICPNTGEVIVRRVKVPVK